MPYQRTLHKVLPSNSSMLEKSMVYAFDTAPHERVIPLLWDADNCPLGLLPWLAWALNVDTWSSDWPESYKRQTLKNAQKIQAIKGTIGAVKQALADLGHESAQVIERAIGGRYHSDDGFVRDGTYRRGESGMWATFSIKLTRPISIAQAALITSRIDNVKRACVHLISLDFTDTPMLRGDSRLYHDAQYTRGIV